MESSSLPKDGSIPVKIAESGFKKPHSYANETTVLLSKFEEVLEKSHQQDIDNITNPSLLFREDMKELPCGQPMGKFSSFYSVISKIVDLQKYFEWTFLL